VLELTLLGPEIEFAMDTLIAVGGATFGGCVIVAAGGGAGGSAHKIWTGGERVPGLSGGCGRNRGRTCAG